MQILVISDTHGRSDRLRQAVLMHENADYIIHCGDGERDCDELLSDFPALAPKLYFVRGNCDHSSRSPELMTLDLPFSHRAVITHGHRYLTGSFRENLVRLARSQDADIVLFLYREDYYKRADDTPSHITELIVAKHRNGPTGRVTLFFKEDCTKFISLTRKRRENEHKNRRTDGCQ